MIEILELINSPKPAKRFRIIVEQDGVQKHYDFGAKNGSTFIDEGNLVKRTNFRKRHLANNTERERITGLIPSPALFSFRILWGNHTDLFDNVVDLQKDFNRL
jgi:hypothetical protein